MSAIAAAPKPPAAGEAWPLPPRAPTAITWMLATPAGTVNAC
jgi:hypothetical protein